jgi:hypothetical protein
MKAVCLIVLLFVVLETAAQEKSHEPHQLIVLISTPRSLSSVFYRMMEARGDCAALSEPGVDAYTLLYTPQFADEICDPTSPKTFEATEKKIVDMLNHHQLVFMKEMGYAASKYLLNTPALRDVILNKAHCVFLISTPLCSA